MKKNKVIICDVDGVLTDGKIYFSDKGETFKAFSLKDFDAYTKIRELGIDVAFVTGEKDGFTEFLKKRLKPEYFIDGCKNKYDTINTLLIKANISWDDVYYIGDGVYDIKALECAGVAACPADAIDEVKNIKGIRILERLGGMGCLSEFFLVLQKEHYF